MAHRTLIRNAQVVLPGETARTSVLLEGDEIAAVDAPAGVRADETVDARGLHLLPGVIDAHVHFREPGLTHKEDLASGSRACAAGGVTSFLEMPNTVPPTTTVKALEAKLALASRKSVVNYGFYIGATLDNLTELERAGAAGDAVRTPGIKVFMGSSTGDMLLDDPESLDAVFARTALPIAAHCEDESTVRANQARLEGRGGATERMHAADAGSVGHARDRRCAGTRGLSVRDHSRIRDRAAAVRSTRRAVELAQRHGRRLHVLHVSTADETVMLADAGPFVTAEACPHHLFLDVSAYDRLGTLAQMNPALKTAADRAALWRALHEGVLQMVATDHAPHALDEKAAPYPESPSGVPAVEVALPLMLDQVVRGACSLQDVVRWMCEGPARVWEIARKGRIEEGLDADLVLADLSLEREVRNEEQFTKCRWSPWHGTRLVGWPVRTWVGGRTVFARDSDHPTGRVDPAPRGREIVFARNEQA